MVHLSRKFKAEMKAKILIFLCTVTIFSTVLALDKVANGKESIIGKLELDSNNSEAINMASNDDESLEESEILSSEISEVLSSETGDARQSEVADQLENIDTITYIYNANDLVAFRDSVNSGNDYAGKTVYVMADIDMSTVCSETLGSFIPIGATGTNFAGTFNGNYHIINNLYIHSNSYVAIGLFSIIAKNGIVQNTIIENVDIVNTYDVADGYNYVGGIAGSCTGTIRNCGINSGIINNVKEKVYAGSSSIYPACYAGGITGRIDRKHTK